MRGRFPDLHRAISIFEIQFAGATTTSGYPLSQISIVAREMVSNCNAGATTYMACWVGTDRGAADHASPVKWCLNEKVELLLQAGHASPVKWCLKEKVSLGKWSAIAMLELQRIRFAGWELTEGQQG